jgi:hypothetical protein
MAASAIIAPQPESPWTRTMTPILKTTDASAGKRPEPFHPVTWAARKPVMTECVWMNY